MQPFDDGLYTGYSTFNNWTSKVPSPLGTKSFSWGLGTMNPLSSGIVTTQPSMSSMASGYPMTSMTSYPATMTMPSVAPMGSSMSSISSMNSINSMGSVSPGGGSTCPYAPPPGAPAFLYNRDQCSNSIAALRYKAKQHTGFPPYAPMAPGQPSALSPCQYATVGNGAGMA